MPVFQKNLYALEQRYPSVAWQNILMPLRDKLPTDLEIIPSKSGQLTLNSRGQAVHSAYNPELEAQKIVQGIDSSSEAFVLIGLGLGYLAQAIHNTYPQKLLILMEPDLPVFVSLLSTCDITELVEDPHTHFLFSTYKEDILQFFRKLNVYSLQTIPNRTLAQRCPEYYETIQKEIRLYVLRRNVNFKTIQEQGELWLQNLCRNMQHFALTPGVSHLRQAFAGYPALLIAAGPSLDTLWPQIAAVQQRCVLVCVDTALRILLQHGITPDFVIAVDSQYWNSRHLDNCESPRSIFVADPSLYPSILKYQNSFHFFLTSSLFPMGKYLEERIEIKGEITSGGSVSTSAFDLCRKLGVNSIWAIGLDLGFPQGHTHARGARFEGWALADGYRLRPAENFFVQQTYMTFPSYHEANYGGQVLTDKRMEVYRLWFEEQAKTIPCFNLSQGVKIENMPSGSWQMLEKLSIRRDEINTVMAKLFSIKIDSESLQTRLAAAVQEMKDELLKIKRLCNDAVIETKKLSASVKNQQNVKKSLEKLEKIDQNLLKSQSKEFLAFLLEPFFQSFQASQREETNPLEALERSCQLYTNLGASTDFYQNILQLSLRLLPPEPHPAKK